jgi:hypothetical protein
VLGSRLYAWRVVALDDVFGISANVDSKSYVDRGGLDERFNRALASDRHIVVHGGSKQGKSWLRVKGLRGDDAIVVQCQPGSSAASLLGEALGRLGVAATLHMSTTREIEGTLDFKGALELGKLLAKAKVEGSAGVTGSSSTTTETEPIGQTAADLLWVAQTILASGKRLVLEDFHYLSEKTQREFAFLLKAMGEYGMFVIVVGVWPRDHLLTYYNGDLDGRIDDIHLTWEDLELVQVLKQGADALKIEFHGDLVDELVREAFGSVGLLQRLAAQLCIAEGIHATHHGLGNHHVAKGPSLEVAKQTVAEQMQGRFQTFADNFIRGMRRLPQGLEVYRHLLQAASDASDLELLDGIDSATLLRRILAQTGGSAIRASDLTQALDRIDRLQVKIAVNPLVLTYSKSSRKLSLADRAFLFFRRHGSPQWPWAAGEPDPLNDLAASDPLDIDAE